MKRFIRIALLCLVIVGALTTSSAFAASVTASISAQNTFTAALSPKYSSTDPGNPFASRADFGCLNLVITGLTGTGSTVTLQVAYDYGSTWIDVASYTVNAVERIWEFEPGVTFRLGVKTGGYVGGPIAVRLSK